jgi:NADH:ubiquinone oxidoreductase subunit H
MTITYTNKYLFIRVLSLLLISLLIIVPVIFSVAFFTVAERKILAKIHRREGPSIVGF